MGDKYQQARATAALWQAKLNALQQALGSNNFFHGTDFRNFLTNGDWQNYQYLTSRAPDPFGVSGTKRYLSANLPEYHLINRIRNAQDLDEVNRQLSLWKQYDPLNAPANIRNYIRMQSVGSVGTRPQFNINEPVPIRGKTGDGAPSTFTYGPGQGYVPNPPVSVPTSDSEVSPEHFGDGSFGAPTYGPGQGYTHKSAKVAVDTSKSQKSAQQTPNNQKDFVPAVEPATQNDKTDKPVVVTDGQPSNGNPSKKTIGWSSGNGYMYEDDHPNNWRTSYGNSGKIKDRDTYTRGSIPGSMGLSYTEPSQVQMTRNDAVPETFSDSDWNAAHGISYVTGKDGLIYRIDPQHPNGYVDPFKNDLSKTGSTGYATGKGMLTSGSNGSYASPSISNDGTYATGEGIKDANGNVLTNPGGDWEYQYALKNPQYGLGMMGKMSDAQKNYLQAVSDNMGYKYNFTGANRFV